jgi:hypothetical protein
MAGNRPLEPPDAVPPETNAELRTQLTDSKHLREEAEGKLVKAELQVKEMSGVLRRIAQAMESNPQSWDELFGARVKKRP